MKTNIQVDKWCKMRKLANNSAPWQLSQSWDIRNTWCMKELGEILLHAASLKKINKHVSKYVVGGEYDETI